MKKGEYTPSVKLAFKISKALNKPIEEIFIYDGNEEKIKKAPGFIKSMAIGFVFAAINGAVFTVMMMYNFLGLADLWKISLILITFGSIFLDPMNQQYGKYRDERERLIESERTVMISNYFIVFMILSVILSILLANGGSLKEYLNLNYNHEYSVEFFFYSSCISSLYLLIIHIIIKKIRKKFGRKK